MPTVWPVADASAFGGLTLVLPVCASCVSTQALRLGFLDHLDRFCVSNWDHLALEAIHDTVLLVGDGPLAITLGPDSRSVARAGGREKCRSVLPLDLYRPAL